MRYLFILIVVVGLGYLYKINQTTDVDIDSFQIIMSQIETADVPTKDVQLGVQKLAEYLCNNVSMQMLAGSSVSSCMDSYQRRKDRCELEVFATTPQMFTKKQQLTLVSQRFSACVGIGQSSQLKPLFERK